ncbi:MAG: radical SAM family heme chaperone HemW [Oscillospiraceae bacterium]|nr:radical SAM family heme chaperone HemW [Oscillospiraceae bacterium]
MEQTVGLYIHIPFCRSKCDYCDFYSLAGAGDQMDAYGRALLRQMDAMPTDLPADTVYVGGGTPSWYGPDRLCALLEGVFQRYRVTAEAEITVEANPDSVTAAGLRQLRRAGFNRLSLGMQSARDDELRSVGRPHDAAAVVRAVEAAREAGFDNLSLDLIYGLPGQDLARWRESVEAAAALAPEHLSCYGLQAEPGTPLYERRAALPDDDVQADLYLWAVRRLEQAGYRQYEISNFARPGRESRHNLRYWRGQPYLGFGPGAHSDFGGRRFSLPRDLEGYLRDAERGTFTLDEDEAVEAPERRREYLMLRLRLREGVERNEYETAFGMPFDPLEACFAAWRRQGLAAEENGRWHLTPEGFLLSNRLIGEILEE